MCKSVSTYIFCQLFYGIIAIDLCIQSCVLYIKYPEPCAVLCYWQYCHFLFQQSGLWWDNTDITLPFLPAGCSHNLFIVFLIPLELNLQKHNILFNFSFSFAI